MTDMRVRSATGDAAPAAPRGLRKGKALRSNDAPRSIPVSEASVSRGDTDAPDTPSRKGPKLRSSVGRANPHPTEVEIIHLDTQRSNKNRFEGSTHEVLGVFGEAL